MVAVEYFIVWVIVMHLALLMHNYIYFILYSTLKLLFLYIPQYTCLIISVRLLIHSEIMELKDMLIFAFWCMLPNCSSGKSAQFTL